MLRGLGVDPCKVYRKAQVQRVIVHIEPGTTQCRFCKKTLRKTQKLKSHIRSFHSRQEALQCPECLMKVEALKVHMCIHIAGGRKYIMSVVKVTLLHPNLMNIPKSMLQGAFHVSGATKLLVRKRG